MTPLQDAREYEATKGKLATLRQRLEALRIRTDLPPRNLSEAIRSYERMILQLQGELEEYEARHGLSGASRSAGASERIAR